MSIRADQFDMDRMIEILLKVEDNPWRKDAEILEGYMPPCPGKDTVPKTVVRWHSWFLKYSKGPGCDPFWDLYGDDFLTPELALKALLIAPAPPVNWQAAGTPRAG